MRTQVLLLCLHWTLIKATTSEEHLKTLDFRAKRQVNALPLIYPYGATYKLITGFTAPIKSDDQIGLIFLFNFQYQYLQFTNSSALSQYYVINQVSREQRDADLAARKNERLVFYKAVTEMMDAFTPGDMFRTIREFLLRMSGLAAKMHYTLPASPLQTTPNISPGMTINTKGMNGQECLLRAICEAAQFPVEEEGFVGEILHVLLTPDYGQSPFEDQDQDLKEALSPYTDAAVAGRQMFSCPYIYKDCPEGQGVLEFITQLRNE